MSLSKSQDETSTTIFRWTNVPFSENQAMGHGNLSKIWIVVFNSAYTKIMKFLRAGKKVKISNLIDWFCLKDKLLGQKNWHSILLSWHWRAMKSFSTIWILVSNSDPQKWLNFLWAGEKVKIPNFITFLVQKINCLGKKLTQQVYCRDTEGIWKI